MDMNRNIDKVGSPDYYIVSEEWLYPTESGRDLVGDFDTYEDALLAAKQKCEEEVYNFMDATKCDPTRPEAFISPDGSSQGVCITCANGLDDWWYAAKIIPVRHGL